MADWSSLEGRVEIVPIREHFDAEDALVEAVRDFDILVVMRERTPLSRATLARLPKLELVVTSGMRNASIDLEAAAEKGVVVCGTKSGSEPPTELTWALILALARNVVAEANALRANGPWQSTVGADLSGKQLGILGLGKIGSRVARIGAAFGMDVVAWSPNLTKERADAAGARLSPSKNELFATSDFITIHLVLGKTTRHLVGRDELARMKKTAYLVNTSRAAIIDQDALVEALTENAIAGAGLDVFEVEPLPHDDVLRRLRNALCTPHLGYVSQANYRAYFQEAVEDIEAFLAGSPVRTLGDSLNRFQW
ncbi:MAG: D-2-hydroxyacid dehydrogenase family protein [Myxococcaceae bacterium]